MANSTSHLWHWIVGIIVGITVIILAISAISSSSSSASTLYDEAGFTFSSEALLNVANTEVDTLRTGYEELDYNENDSFAQESFIVYTGSVNMLVDSVNDAMTALDEIASSHSGYIEYSYVDSSDAYVDGYATLRVDAEDFTQTMDDIQRLATSIRYASVSSDDVTEQVIDIQARLSNAQAEEEAYLEVLNIATTVDDILNVRRYLSDVRETIERYEAQLEYYESVTSLATITVEMTEDTSIILDSGTFRPSQTIVDAAQTVVSLIQTLIIAIIWIIIVGGAITIPLALIMWIGRGIYRRNKQ